MAVEDQFGATESFHADSNESPADTAPAQQPERIGRYRIKKLLGKGGFGLVYLGHDEQLDRPVAVKVPHSKLISRPKDALAYVAEARTVAKLDHPSIVPVHDVGSTENCPCYVVSKYIEGLDLATRIKHSRLKYTETAELVATVAEALHYAHKQGLVHRDVKPGNILIGNDGKPYVVDFGLALREENIGKGPKYAGTPAYMSPEQARGEGHRVDGRSDIFSLGVVFYELLAGRQPFRGDTQAELLEQVTSYEPRPLRQYDEKVPKELERICQMAMAKRASDRYSSAHDLAEDLRHFLAEPTVTHSSTTPGSLAAAVPGTVASQVATTSAGSLAAATTSISSRLSSDSQPLKIVPKGLRSFDAHDADFFLELLPGARDRDGLPDSLRFWKARIEETDADNTFSVGLIYGPSGCGKSSLVKAGLLPSLSDDVLAVYLEATAEETETRLLHGLRKHCPSLDDTLSLKETLAALRRGQGIPVGKKILVVLDQFEQWLHAKKEEENTELVQALRQCDGGRVQCIVMVRDDFWLSVSRFLRELEIRLLEGQNSALADLFDGDHGKKVLAAFGRAFGKLPQSSGETSKDQKEFLKQAVSGLAQDGKIICVRLALFAEMMKGKPWTPATLKEVGGTEGVGVTFLEETFCATTAPPAHRYHQQAARAVLKALLPASGTDIKGQMKSYNELLEASGYARRPKDFNELVTILDREMRLITPTEVEGLVSRVEGQKVEGEVSLTSTLDSQPSGSRPSTLNPRPSYYQLTHDYLVLSLREWLTRKQKETWRGRAELRLGERAALWTAKPENRHLPSWWEYLSIVGLTSRKNWTEPQRKMMRAAGRLQFVRATGLALILIVLTYAGWEANGYWQAQALIKQLVSAKEDAVLGIVAQLRPYQRWAKPQLREVLARDAQTAVELQQQLHARVALVGDDDTQIAAIQEALLAAEPAYVGVLREALRTHQRRVASDFARTLRDSTVPADRRFRAGLALAAYWQQDNLWTPEDFRFLAAELVAANPEHQPRLREYLRPVAGALLADFERLFADQRLAETQQLAAANALADFAPQDAARIARLIVDATPGQYRILYPVVPKSPDEKVAKTLRDLVAQQPASDLPHAERLKLGQRRAGAAITLLRQGSREEIFAALRVGDDPESLTQFVHRCRAREVRPQELLECVGAADNLRATKAGAERAQEDRVLYGLLLALGEFSLEELPQTERVPLMEQLAQWYGQDSSSAIHGASGWLLRHWQQDEKTRQVDQTPVPYDPAREWFTIAVKTSDETTSYFTFIVFPAGEYQIGSAKDEPDRRRVEVSHDVRITRPFAILDREITMGELLAFNRSLGDFADKFTVTPEQAAVGPNWYDAVGFCRWLTERAGMGEEDQAYADPKSLDKDLLPPDRDQAAGGAPRNWPVRLHKPGFRLPTEAEWEIACRSGMQSAYSFGRDESALGNYGWFVENSGKHVQMPRGRRPNARGLFDMHGNVWEWCHDWLGNYATMEGKSDSEGAPEGSLQMNRGGSWYLPAAFCRSANSRSTCSWSGAATWAFAWP